VQRLGLWRTSARLCQLFSRGRVGCINTNRKRKYQKGPLGFLLVTGLSLEGLSSLGLSSLGLSSLGLSSLGLSSLGLSLVTKRNPVRAFLFFYLYFSIWFCSLLFVLWVS